MSGQSIVDRLNAAKHTVAGSALGRAVVKATTEEIMGPKRKHLDYLLQCTSEINVSIPQMADLLIERTQNSSWVVTYKALITIHHLMCFGNERFSQYMASHSSKFTLNNFMDRTGAQGIDMSSYIRKYAYYLNEKRETYKLMGFDFCKVKRGKDDGLLRTMNTEKLLKTLPILQKQLDALVQFDVQPNELTNGVINSCFVLLSKDLIRLFACYNDGIINLLEKFFDMNKKNCREALDIYKKFLERTDQVAAFLKVAESSGMDKSDIPDLTKAPSSLLEALESHVNGLEKKGGNTNGASSAPSAKPSTAVTNAISSLNNNTNLTAEEKRRVIEEEAKTLESFKSNHLKKQTSLSSPTSELTNGVHQKSTAPAAASSNQNDLFGLDLTSSSSSSNGAAFAPTPVAKTNGSASDDLLQLSGANPFIQNIVNQSYATQPTINPFQPNPGMMMSGAPVGGMPMQPSPMGGLFQPAVSNPMMPMNSMNQAANNQKFDAFGDVLQPTNTNSLQNPMSSSKQSNGNLADKSQDSKILSKDLDSSLASLADNLDINNKNKTFGNKNHQWNPNQPNNSAKTGGQNWKPTGGAPAVAQPAPMVNSWNPVMNNQPMGMNPMMGAPMAAPQPAMGWNQNPFGMAPPAMNSQPNPMMMPGLMQQQQIRPAVGSANPFDLL